MGKEESLVVFFFSKNSLLFWTLRGISDFILREPDCKKFIGRNKKKDDEEEEDQEEEKNEKNE